MTTPPLPSPAPAPAHAPNRRATDKSVSTVVLLAFAACLALTIAGFVVLSLEHVDPGPLGLILSIVGTTAVPTLVALLKVDRLGAKVDAVAAATGDRLDQRLFDGAASAITGLIDPQFFANSGQLPTPGKTADPATLANKPDLPGGAS